MDRVLVVEDNPINRRLFTAWLERAGYEVEAAEDTLRAKELLLTGEFCAAVIDAVLPGSSGLSLCRYIRSTEGLKSLPVLCVTAFDVEEIRQSLQDGGCTAYRQKPLQEEAFVAAIKSLIEGASAS